MEAMTYASYVLVTGGSGGIGSEVCRLCPSFGFTPIIGYKARMPIKLIFLQKK